MTRIELLPGQRFGKLIILRFSHMAKAAMWECRCDCGTIRTAPGSYLVRGKIKSCGCLHRPHGESTARTPIYRIWLAMQQRCKDPRHIAYPRYGGRGIRVCPEWRHDFPAFRFWALSHGYVDNLTIDRVDNDGNYEPGNCQWLTKSENSIKAHREQKERSA